MTDDDHARGPKQFLVAIAMTLFIGESAWALVELGDGFTLGRLGKALLAPAASLFLLDRARQRMGILFLCFYLAGALALGGTIAGTLHFPRRATALHIFYLILSIVLYRKAKWYETAEGIDD